MNLFEKYGIKEVADVVFYSINQVGDNEVIYTPVLYLDTLKVSTIEKSAESTFATGGLKNKNLIKWNYGKKISLNLEDALFSPASMSLIWGGKLDSKLSDATSVVSKINFANTYGRLQYSVKAYPSPALTKDEWEIVFKIIGQKILNPDTAMPYDTIPDNYDGASWVLDNNYYSNLSEELKSAFRRRYAMRPYLFNGTAANSDIAGQETWTYSYDKENFGTNFGQNYLKISMLQIEGYEGINEHYNIDGSLKPGHEKWYEAKALPEYIIYVIRNEITELEHIGNFETNISQVEVVDRMEKCLVKNKDGFIIDTKKQLDNLFRFYADDKSSTYSIYYDVKTMLPLMGLNDTGAIGKTYHVDIQQNGSWQITDGQRRYESDYQEKSYFQTLSLLANKKVYRADITKIEKLYGVDNTAAPQFTLDHAFRWMCAKALEDLEVVKDLNEVIDSIGDYSFLVDSIEPYSGTMVKVQGTLISFVINGKEQIKIKYGTSYYKWTRTVKYKEYEDDSVLGTSFVIDADTFPDDYRIVCETYIRNQKTGKDQRYQITIFKANVSSDTSITLSADGEPTTFNMTIDVLSPENDIMMDMRQIDVEEDKFEGGTRIIPQRSKFTSTPTMEDVGEVIAPINNNEIY